MAETSTTLQRKKIFFKLKKIAFDFWKQIKYWKNNNAEVLSNKSTYITKFILISKYLRVRNPWAPGGPLNEIHDNNSVDQNATSLCVCVCVCVWIPSSPASSPTWHQISAPCPGHPSFLLLWSPDKVSSDHAHLSRTVSRACPTHTLYFQPDPDSHEYDHSGSAAGSSSEQANSRAQPCFAAVTRCAKIGINVAWKRNRRVGPRGLVSYWNQAADLQIPIKFLGHFYGEILATSESGAIAQKKKKKWHRRITELDKYSGVPSPSPSQFHTTSKSKQPYMQLLIDKWTANFNRAAE